MNSEPIVMRMHIDKTRRNGLSQQMTPHIHLNANLRRNPRNSLSINQNISFGFASVPS